MKPHPLYVKAAAGDYLTAAETGRLIRERLARAFPATTFYVRTSTYAGGASVHVYYDGRTGYRPLESCYCHPAALRVVDPTWPNRCQTCGYVGRLDPIYRDGAPTAEQVEAIAKPYAGSAFDGMIDLKYSIRAWLTPDGNAFFGRSDGTAGSHGSDPAYSEPRPVPGAVAADFLADFVFVDPELPYDIAHRAEEQARKARVRDRNATIRATTGRRGISRADVRRFRAAHAA